MRGLASCLTSGFLVGIGCLLASTQLGLASDDRPWDAASETKARKLYLLKCAKCHVAYEPNAYTAETWSAWMGKMYARTKLKTDQSELLDEFERRLRQDGRSIKAKGKEKIKPVKPEPKSSP
jgi:hypothetical protein